MVFLSIFFLQFTDKVGAERVCLSPTAMEMREARGIAIDSLDYEVSPIYLDSVQTLGATVQHTSRWMNGATVQASEEVIEVIEACEFVESVERTRGGRLQRSLVNASLLFSERSQSELQNGSITANGLEAKGDEAMRLLGDEAMRLEAKGESAPQKSADFSGTPQAKGERRSAPQKSADFSGTPQAGEQLDQLNLLPLHEAGYKGRGIRIGIADGGFYRANSMLSLPQDQCLGYADLTDDEEDMLSHAGSHGTMCLSTLMATKDDYTGAATEAEYYLFRTEEEYTESPKEIDNWVAAIEMADSMGLHIVSSSLGYTTFDDAEMDFQYADMDGRTSRAAQAAAIAARKGMLLVVAAGNDGNKDWHYLSTPADADSVLTVGAVDVDGQIAAFSSYGPSADGRVKPEVCAMGVGTSIIHPENDSIMGGNGTSFACPLIAGMAACVWSALPDATNMEIRERIIRSADRYTQPHEQYGYGIPDAWMAYQMATGTNNIIHAPQATKIMKDGQLYILYNNEYYTLLGNKISKQ